MTHYKVFDTVTCREYYFKDRRTALGWLSKAASKLEVIHGYCHKMARARFELIPIRIRKSDENVYSIAP